MASKKRRGQHGDHGAPWHAVVWITATVLTLSLSTMTLAAFAQSTSSNFPKNVTGIFQSLTELKREIRSLGARILVIEAKMKNRGLIRENANTVTKPVNTPISAAPGGNLSRGEEPAPKPEAEPTPTPTPTANTQSPSNAITPTPQPQPDPQKAKNLDACLSQCNSAFNSCIAATNETPLVPGGGNDWACTEYNEKECKGLCADWFFYPTPTKLPIQLGAQTCLLGCRTAMAYCFKAAKIKYNVTDPKVPPPQDYFNALSDCSINQDNACRVSCPAMSPNATAKTQ